MNFSELRASLTAITDGIPYEISNLANVSALLHQELPDINWVGFYKLVDGVLILGPFQGKPACIRIPVGKGVCGTAAAACKTIRVEDVHRFPGHIACDSASCSEIVLPLFRNGALWGVLDIDSPLTGRFSAEDGEGLQLIADSLSEMLSGI